MTKFNIGDKVVMCGSDGNGSWRHGRSIEKESAYKNKTVLVIRSKGFKCTGCNDTCYETYHDHCDMMTIPSRFLRSAEKKIIIIER